MNAPGYSPLTSLKSANSASPRSARGLLLGSLCALGLALSACVSAGLPGSPTAGVDPGENGRITIPPVPSKVTTNQLQGAKLWIDANSQAAVKAREMRAKDPAKAAILEKIAKEPQALWLGEWSGDIFKAVRATMESAKASGGMPIFIAYNLPGRDCGQHSAGGLKNGDEYRRWIRRLAAGIGDGGAVIILEPDAIGLLTRCLDNKQQDERLALIKDAVRVLRQNPKVAVYIDSGHAHWDPAPVFAERIKRAGVDEANGFSLNTSNYVTTEENLAFGKAISEALGGSTHFIIDTSRNGNGATPDNEWCNPAGRKLGKPPTTVTGEPLVDGYLWLKRPGESDGACNGGPKAGDFWTDRAIDLAK